VEVFFQLRQLVGNPMSALANLVKGILRTQHFWNATNKGKSFALEKRSRTILSIELRQGGLVVEKFQLAGRTGHVHINHPFGAGVELRRKNRKRRLRVAAEIEMWRAVGVRPDSMKSRRRQCPQKHRTDTGAEGAQEMPARLGLNPRQLLFQCHFSG